MLRNLTGDDARNLSLAVSEIPGSLISVVIADVDGKLYYNRFHSVFSQRDYAMHAALAAHPFEPVERPE